MAGRSVAEAPKRLFKTQSDWAAWLAENHDCHPGLWLRIAKKNSKVQSVSYPDALDTALCYGWIDGQKRPENEKTWLQKFVPRAPKSIWSKINREKALALLKDGKMKRAGLAAIKLAKANSRWEAAYDSQSHSTVPPDFEAALCQSPRAKTFFSDLDSANRYAILFRIQNVKKAETRERKIKQFIEMLEKHETIHPRRAKSAK
jgi:uncharacterized protein YdeI (YjbR/CyaY-like superfamily)